LLLFRRYAYAATAKSNSRFLTQKNGFGMTVKDLAVWNNLNVLKE
jgi:hypothetical protein